MPSCAEGRCLGIKMQEQQEIQWAANDGENEGADRRPSTRRQSVVENGAKMDEFARLTKYVSAYREHGAAIEEEGEIQERRVWYAPWKKRKVRVKKIERGAFPEDWLMTDIHHGLSDSDVETRRKRAGFNELAAEKQNWFAQVLGYFQGPILYGTLHQ